MRYLTPAVLLLAVLGCKGNHETAALNLQGGTALAATTATATDTTGTSSAKKTEPPSPPKYLVRELFNWPARVIPSVPSSNRNLHITNVQAMLDHEAKAGWELVTSYTVSGTPTAEPNLAINYERVVFIFRKR